MTKEEVDILFELLNLRHEEWFKRGLDAPETIIDSLSQYDVDNQIIANAIGMIANGPGYTDMWIKNNTLFSEIDNFEEMEDQIFIDNRNSFKEGREETVASLSDEIPDFFRIEGISSERIYNFLKDRL